MRFLTAIRKEAGHFCGSSFLRILCMEGRGVCLLGAFKTERTSRTPPLDWAAGTFHARVRRPAKVGLDSA